MGNDHTCHKKPGYKPKNSKAKKNGNCIPGGNRNAVRLRKKELAKNCK